MPNTNIIKVSQIELDSSFFSSLNDAQHDNSNKTISVAAEIANGYADWQRVKKLVAVPNFEPTEKTFTDLVQELTRGLTYDINSAISRNKSDTLNLAFNDIKQYIAEFSADPIVQWLILYFICQQKGGMPRGEETFGVKQKTASYILGLLFETWPNAVQAANLAIPDFCKIDSQNDTNPITIKLESDGNTIVFSDRYPLIGYYASLNGKNDVENPTYAKCSYEYRLNLTTYDVELSQFKLTFPHGHYIDKDKLAELHKVNGAQPVIHVDSFGNMRVIPLTSSHLKRQISELKDSIRLTFSYARNNNAITFWENDNLISTDLRLLSDAIKGINVKKLPALQSYAAREEIMAQLQAELAVSVRRLIATGAAEDVLYLQRLVKLCDEQEFSLKTSLTANYIPAIVNSNVNSEFIVQHLSQALLQNAVSESDQQELFAELEQLLNNPDLVVVKKHLIVDTLLQNVKDFQNNSDVIRLINVIIRNEEDVLSFLMEPTVSFGSKIVLLNFWKQKNSSSNNFAIQLTNYFKIQFANFGQLREGSSEVVEDQRKQLATTFVAAANFVEIDNIDPAGNFCAAFKNYLFDKRYPVSQKLNLLASIQSMRAEFSKPVQDQLNKATQKYLTETAESLAKMVAAKDTFFARFSKKAQVNLKTAEQQLSRLVTIAFKNDDMATVSKIQQHIRESKLSAAARLKIMARMKALRENNTDFTAKVADLFKPVAASSNSRLARAQHWIKYAFSPSYRALCKEVEVMSKAAVTMAMSHVVTSSSSTPAVSTSVTTITEVPPVPVPVNNSTTTSTRKIKRSISSLSSLSNTGSLHKDKTETIVANRAVTPTSPISNTLIQLDFDKEPVSPDSINSRNSFISTNSMPPLTFFISFSTDKNKDAKQADTPTSQQSGSNTPSLTTATGNKPRSHSDPIPVPRPQSIGVK